MTWKSAIEKSQSIDDIANIFHQLFDTPLPTPDIEAVEVRPVATDIIKTDPERFQFKLNSEAQTGAGLALKDVAKWNDAISGVLTLWRALDGNIFVVNGHQRLSVAKRLGVKNIRAQVLDAKDWSPAQARALGALINIAEGRGNPIDFAKFIRDSGKTTQDLEAEGISMTETKTQQALGLSKLVDVIFQEVVMGRFPMERGAIIGKELADNQPAQIAIYQSLKKLEDSGRELSNSKLRELIRIGQMSAIKTEKQLTLFGEEELQQSLMIEQAEILDYAKRLLREDKSLFGLVERKKERLAAANNVIDPETNQVISEDAALMLDMLDKAAYYKGTQTNAALQELARQLADTGPKTLKKKVLKESYERIKEAVRADYRQLTSPAGPDVSELNQTVGPETGGTSEPELGSDRGRTETGELDTATLGLFGSPEPEKPKELPTDRVSMVKRAMPGISEEQAQILAQDEELFRRMTQGQFSALDREHALKKMADKYSGKQASLMDMGGKKTGLFEAAYQLRVVDIDNLILESSAGDRSKIQKKLSEVLSTQDFQNVNFGKLSPDKLNKINEIREGLSEPVLQNGELVIPKNVVKKLYEKRMLLDGMSANQVADLLYSIFHSNKSKVVATKHSHIQALVNARTELSRIGFLGLFQDEITVIKSGYKAETDKLQQKIGSKKATLGGRGTPPSAVNSDIDLRQSPRKISGVQDGLAEHNINTSDEKRKRINKEDEQITESILSQDSPSQILAASRLAMRQVIYLHVNTPRAVNLPGLGWVAFYWGELKGSGPNFSGSNGVAKIIAKQDWSLANIKGYSGLSGKDLAVKLAEVVVRGRVIKHYQDPVERVVIGFGEYTVDLLAYYEGEDKVWLLTWWGYNGDQTYKNSDFFGKNYNQLIHTRPTIGDVPGELVTESAEIRTPVTVEENIARGREAMKRVIAKHVNEPRAMYRQDLGWIAFYWGKPGRTEPERNNFQTDKEMLNWWLGLKNRKNIFKKGYGISHIVAKRGWEGRYIKPLLGQTGTGICFKLVDVIAKGILQKAPQSNATITFDGFQVSLALTYFQKEQVWVLSGMQQVEDIDYQLIYESSGD